MPERARLIGEVEVAARSLSPYWPLPGFVAINPLRGWEDRPFATAVATATRYQGGRGYWGATTERLADIDARWQSGSAEVNRHLIQALTAFCDQGQAAWNMPNRHQGLYRAWRAVAQHDPLLRSRRRLRTLPDAALACVQTLTADTAAGEARIERLRGHLHALPGWASFVRWRAQRDSDPWQQHAPVTVVDFLAVRMALCHCLDVAPAEALAHAPTVEDGIEQLRAREARWRAPLLQQLGARALPAPSDKPATAAQLVFCIDVRSEVLRRHIEATGPYETLGFAGFFGVPMAWQALDESDAVASCPVLVDPQHLVREHAHQRGGKAIRQWRGRQRWRQLGKRLADSLKSGIAASFAYVEASGWAFGLSMAQANLAPRRERPQAQPPSTATHIRVAESDGHGIAHDQQIFYAEAALKTMGLIADFAPLVVLCGHGGETVNNPYARALDCGACGGQSGGPNARVLTQILNQRRVRAALATRGIDIPETTVFLAAEHNTTTDEVRLLDAEAVPPDHATALQQLLADLAQARRHAAAERCRQLPNSAGDPVAVVEQRCRDWSEVRPEWGLAGNAAFLVGPRWLSADLDLEGRCFLHSYDWQSDGRGRALEIILTAPMVVAHWINSQYYFSTVDTQVFGAGSKTTQTVVGRLGVLQGNGSDLMTGLPEQSVLRPDGQAQHEPLRLLTVVHAPPERIESVIQRNGVLQRLFDNEWVAVAAIDPRSGDVRQRQPGGSWLLHAAEEAGAASTSPSPSASSHSTSVSEHAL
ncbi:DUF2309 domain-containing protein [Algiphilus sp.]|uniref:DUF2309 domain-containing protein n=1 Tax=Algiphilus sp. TaxID=1872431 RepID=UPI003B51E90D